MHRAFLLSGSFLSFLTVTACSGNPGSGNAALPGGETVKAAPAVEKVAPIPTPMETFRALAPPEGLKVTQLFSTPVSDTDDRIKRVENAVQAMRNDFDTVMPSMVRMVSMEKNLQDLVAQLQTLNGQSPEPSPGADPLTADTPAQEVPLSADHPGEDDESWASIDAVDDEDQTAESVNAPAALLPADLQAAEKTAPVINDQTPAPASADAIGLTALRVGDHGAVSRLVLDMTGKTALAVSFQNDHKQLAIDLTGLRWAGKEKAMLHSTLVSGYHIDGQILLVDLKHPAQIKSQQILPPGEGAGYRAVIDLFAADAPAP